MPIVTKCSTNDSEIDLDVIKSNMYEMFENEFKQQENETKLVRRESVIEHSQITNQLSGKKSSTKESFITPNKATSDGTLSSADRAASIVNDEVIIQR